ncbi:MAG: hypothetical protein M3261_02695 [Thermoproteota archaeon]|nr:hypothetical protein [Thermoproteota archaeon]
MNLKQKLVSKITATVVVVTALIGVGGFAVIPSFGQADSTTQKISTPFESGGIPLCGTEEIQFSGTANYILHTTTGPDGKFQYSITHVNFQGVKAVSLTSGDTYPLTQVFTHITQVSASEFLTIADFTLVHGTLATKGGETNSIAQIVFRTSIDADGEPIMTIDHVELKCV